MKKFCQRKFSGRLVCHSASDENVASMTAKLFINETSSAYATIGNTSEEVNDPELQSNNNFVNYCQVSAPIQRS